MSAIPQGNALCGASTYSGTPCKRKVAFGFTRCNLHGGASPAAKIKAEQAMSQARMPAIEALYTIIDQFNSNTCDTCGYPSGEAAVVRATIRACEVVLDRTGMPARSQVEVVSQSDGDLSLAMMNDDEKAELSMLISQLNSLKARVRERHAANLDAPPQQSPGTQTHTM